jgi:S-adenosylmethionine synthetase
MDWSQAEKSSSVSISFSPFKITAKLFINIENYVNTKEIESRNNVFKV